MSTVGGVEITGAAHDRDDEVLTPQALKPIAPLHRELNPRRLELLAARQERVRALADGGTLEFLPETAGIREDGSWRVADPAPGLEDRRVEMTGLTTEAGLRSNISVGIRYLESWLRGSGAVGINNLMEDAATAEISRGQVWQWLHNGVELSDGQPVTRELVRKLVDEEMAAIAAARGDAFAGGRWDDARALFTEMALADEYADFLTLPAYERMP
jgi:malate synthase